MSIYYNIPLTLEWVYIDPVSRARDSVVADRLLIVQNGKHIKHA